MWGGIQLGLVCTCLTQGAVIQYLGTHWLYVFSFPFALAVIVPGLFHKEKRVSKRLITCALDKSHVPAEGDTAKPLTVQSRRRVVLMSIEIGVVAVLLTLSGVLVSNNNVLLLIALSLALVVVISFFLAMPPVVAKVSTFFLLNSMSAVSVEGASFYFFTDEPKQYKHGPHFSPIFYTTVIGLVSASFGLLGVLAYQGCLTKWRYRPVFLLTSIILIGTSLTQVRHAYTYTHVCANTTMHPYALTLFFTLATDCKFTSQVPIFKRWNLLVNIPDEVGEHASHTHHSSSRRHY